MFLFFVFFTKNTFVILGNGGKNQKKTSLHESLPDMGKGAEQIVYDNQCNMAYYLLPNRFRRAGELGIAQEEARVAQGEIITASGVSDSIALTEGGGV